MKLDQARANLAALNRIQAQVEALVAAEEGAAMKGAVDDLVLPLVRIRRDMRNRLDVLQANEAKSA